jgi:hypothetical protein
MSSDEPKDIDFGEIKNIELNTNWNLEPLMEFVYSELANDMSHWPDLYKNGDESRMMRRVNFPQKIEIKVYYDRYIQTWVCFQTEEWINKKDTEKLKSYENMVKLWRSVPIQTVKTTPTQENWVKEIFGLKFFISSLQYLEEVDK